ncbi:PEP-CTERM sorting domain-containing protein [Undibacterium sp.]|uniref:PEP-CTERM sorting domain-containing protein n=1 Tax=Undibacterium sp. TaxID=1914977 RepID=UPI002C423C22|nr:PEP-CTERM sorting domain-containing protein [Undibacterium sp.]HTD03364.1 PEP-CTERM sorting domain-containing protein [Undibacterium sp.]
MKTITRGLISFVSLITGLLIFSAAQAAPINVTYTTTGSAGNWILDFSLTNNLDAGDYVYFFGVVLSDRQVVASPSGFNSNAWPNWNNSSQGGSSLNYNNNWIDLNFSAGVASGATLGGFEVKVTDLIAPASVNWFAYGVGGNWTGGGNFSRNTNPGFEGLATNASVVPEPATMAIFVLGLLGLVAMRRRKQ